MWYLRYHLRHARQRIEYHIAMPHYCSATATDTVLPPLLLLLLLLLLPLLPLLLLLLLLYYDYYYLLVLRSLLLLQLLPLPHLLPLARLRCAFSDADQITPGMLQTFYFRLSIRSRTKTLLNKNNVMIAGEPSQAALAQHGVDQPVAEQRVRKARHLVPSYQTPKKCSTI